MIKYIFKTDYYNSCLRKDYARGANQKARNDIQSKAVEYGYRSVNRKVVARKGVTSFCDIIFLLKIEAIKKNSLFLLQYPENMNEKIFRKVLCILKKRRAKVVIWLHDVYGARSNDSARMKREAVLLGEADLIVSHNSCMTNWLKDVYKINSNIVEMELFDYLSRPINDNRKEKNGSVIIAGNLDAAKAGYLRKVIEYNPTCVFSLYGSNYSDIKYPNATYYGVYGSDELPGVLNGSWGLIWDGPSMESCEENYGRYLKINNPHKMSLYMAAGIPVIVWTESAMADFVKKNNVGIAVKSLMDLDEKLSAVSEYEYEIKRNNTLLQKKRVSEGFYSAQVLKLIDENWIHN